MHDPVYDPEFFMAQNERTIGRSPPVPFKWQDVILMFHLVHLFLLTDRIAEHDLAIEPACGKQAHRSLAAFRVLRYPR